MYQKLRDAIDALWLIDEHGHPGITMAWDKRQDMPEADKIPFRDGYNNPTQSSGGYQYLKDLHYEAYEKLYGWDRRFLDDPANLEQITAVYEEKRLGVRTFIDEIMKASRVEHFMANFYIPEELEGKENISLVPGIDGLLFPFDDSYLYNRQFSRQYLKDFRYCFEIMQKRFGPLPEPFNLQEYLAFVDAVLEGYQKIDHVPAVKFGVTYARSLYFPNVDNLDGEKLLETARAGDTEAYDNFQSLIFWYIMRKLQELDLPVQIHTAVTDACGSYFNPENLQPLLEDKQCYNTKIVLLHAGYPNYDAAFRMALFANIGPSPNQIYIDISGRIMFSMHPRIIAKEMEKWLAYPALRQKVLYGSDTLFGERYIYVCAKAGRDAVYWALEGLLDKGILSGEEEAIGIAKDVLRNNAIRLYHLPYELA